MIFFRNKRRIKNQKEMASCHFNLIEPRLFFVRSRILLPEGRCCRPSKNLVSLCPWKRKFDKLGLKV